MTQYRVYEGIIPPLGLGGTICAHRSSLIMLASSMILDDRPRIVSL